MDPIKRTSSLSWVALLLAGWILGSWGTPGNWLGSSTVLAAPSSEASADSAAIVKETAGGSQLLYLIDPRQKIVSIYVYDTKGTKLKLAAVRHYAADHRLAEFNNEPPNVADIEKLVAPR